MNKNRPPTMADVAKAAGVSPMTVSRALRPNTSASKETRARILEAAEALGYVLDSTASGLSSRHSGFVAMTIPSINNTNFSDTLRGLSDGLKETGLDLLLGYTNYDIDEEERVVRSLLRRRPEAIVVTGGNHTEQCRKYLSASGVPVIETWDLPDDPIGHVVGFSNAQAGELVAQHFYDQGLRKIGFIGGHTLRDTRGFARRTGFLNALKRLGLEDHRVADTGVPPTTIARGAKGFADLLERHPDTQAVMCVSDPVAFGALMECQRRGIEVPSQMAIAGFGDDDISESCYPNITTVEVGPFDIGMQTAQIIQAALDETSEFTPIRSLKSECQLRIRQSSDLKNV